VEKTLIIKTGHTETFYELEENDICSLGDVLRSTFILENFDNVTWVTDQKALPLLKYGKVKKLLTLGELTVDVVREHDLIINLEKSKNILDIISSHPNVNGITRNNTENIKKIQLLDDKTYQEKLCILLEIKWNQQPYSFNYTEKKQGEGVGLNWKVGEKFPEKNLPKSFWNDLSTVLSKNFQIKWQEGFDCLDEYINWINSCETIITLDSLGTHIAIALEKNVICLFGATNSNEVHLYSKGAKITHAVPMNSQEILKIIRSIKNELSN